MSYMSMSHSNYWKIMSSYNRMNFMLFCTESRVTVELRDLDDLTTEEEITTADNTTNGERHMAIGARVFFSKPNS